MEWAVTALTPIVVVVFAWATKRKIDANAAEDSRLEIRLSQQRADFDSLIKPLQDTVASLYTRVGALELRASKAEGDTRTLAQGLRDTLEYMEDRYQDPGPELSERVLELLEHK